jgi:Fibronectin type III domain
MTNLVLAARSVVLCTLVTFGLVGCGSDEGSSASAAAASTDTLVSPSVGLIDRSGGNVTQGTAPASSSTPPASSSTTPVSASTTAPSTNTSTPVATPPIKIGSTGTATLDWTPPTQNSDGSVLTNLAGYTVYYGTSPDNLTETVKVSNPGVAAYTLSNLAPGTWYFAVTAYSAARVESARSGVVSTQI